MRLFCIADEDTVRGFQLAGVDGQAVASEDEAAAALDRAIAQPDCGIIVLTDNVAAGIARQVEAIRRERARPLLVEIPGPDGLLARRKSLRQLVQEAVGIPLAPAGRGTE